MDMMLKTLNIDLDLIGYSKEAQRWDSHKLSLQQGAVVPCYQACNIHITIYDVHMTACTTKVTYEFTYK
jgi:hypothetical protein